MWVGSLVGRKRAFAGTRARPCRRATKSSSGLWRVAKLTARQSAGDPTLPRIWKPRRVTSVRWRSDSGGKYPYPRDGPLRSDDRSLAINLPVARLVGVGR